MSRPRALARPAHLVRFACLAAIALACGGGDPAAPGEEPVVPASISFSTVTAIVGVRAQVRLDLTVRDAQNRDITSDAEIEWSTSNPSLATVNDTGLISGVTLGGPVTITATSGEHTATIALTVTPARIDFAPSVSTMVVSSTVQLSASAVDFYGAPLDAGPVTWASSDAGIATIDQTGLVTALAPGNAQISGTAGGRTSLFGLLVGMPTIYDGGYFSTGLAQVHITVQFGRVIHVDASLHPTPTCNMSISSSINVPISAVGGFQATLALAPGGGTSATTIIGTFGGVNSVTGSIFGTLPASCQYGQQNPVSATLGTFSAYR